MLLLLKREVPKIQYFCEQMVCNKWTGVVLKNNNFVFGIVYYIIKKMNVSFLLYSNVILTGKDHIWFVKQALGSNGSVQLISVILFV